jgi:hypothetical protein
MTEDYDHYRIWYAEPLKALEEMPNGQGGFVALATACFLYERYAIASLNIQGRKADRLGKIQQIARDFDVDIETATAFWDVIRDGLLHQGMPMQKKQGRVLLPRYAFHHLYPPMVLENIQGEKWLKVQPWKFMHKVLNLWDSNFELLQKNGSFPWANIGLVPE